MLRNSPKLSDPARSVPVVLATVDIAATPGYTISAVSCDDDHRGWSEVESAQVYRMVLVRRGRFRRRGANGASDLDRTLGYLGTPGEAEQFAHPHGGDVCTSVSVQPSVWAQLVGHEGRLARSTLYVTARLELAHRRLLATAARGEPDDALAEVLTLLTAAVGQLVHGRTALTQPSAPGDRALVSAAREAIIARHPAAARLPSLAELLGVSPFRLSRAFPRELGVSVTRYRNRIRVAEALDRLERGEPSLAALAADLGFADQAHLTRTLREHIGHPPTALRRLLCAPASGP